MLWLQCLLLRRNWALKKLKDVCLYYFHLLQNSIFILSTNHWTEHTILWDIMGSEGYNAAFKNQPKKRHLRRQDAMQTLNSDVSWFLPFFQILPVKNTPLRFGCLATPTLCNTELLEASTSATIHTRSSTHKCFQGHFKLVHNPANAFFLYFYCSIKQQTKLIKN